MKELRLLFKQVILEESPILLQSTPDENWERDWQVMAGDWKEENGWLIGAERGNKGGILFSKQSFLYADDVLVTELIDPCAISGGHVGFSPYCTMLAIKDIEVRRAVWMPFEQSYGMEALDPQLQS